MHKKNWNDENESDDDSDDGSGEISEQNTPTELKEDKEPKMKFEESKESDTTS